MPFLLQPLYERCGRLRPALFRLASDTADDDEALTQILAANDELTLVLNAYKEQLLRRGGHPGAEGSSSQEEAEPRGEEAAAPSGGLLHPRPDLISFS